MTSKIRNISIASELTGEDVVADIEYVYKHFFDRLFSYARILCDSEELAQDVLADFFYGLLKNQTDLAKIDNLEVYLIVGVKNLCIQKLKKNAHEEKNASLLASVDYVDPQQVLLGKELKTLLDTLIDNLPDQCQLIFRMSKEKGLSNKEIAAELGIGLGTVKTQLVRAQSKLREAIISHYADDKSLNIPWRLIGQILLVLGGF